jgi:hypothetical protein
MKTLVGGSSNHKLSKVGEAARENTLQTAETVARRLIAICKRP